MGLSAEQIQALADTVAIWRMQEYIYIAFYCFYVYYIITTMDEEVSVIFPQKWNRGKMLYMVIRYAEVIYIAVQLSAEYRSYFSIPLMSCKAMMVIYKSLDWLVITACDFTLGLCLGALLQANTLSLIAILVLSCGLPSINAAINLVATIQYQYQPVSPLPAELGYACPYAAPVQWAQQTIAYVGRSIREYLTLSATAVLAGLGVLALIMRYRGQGGRLLQVICRDGGIHYMSLLGFRLVNAIIYTPAIIVVPNLDASPVFQLLNVSTDIVIPILAQRLLINMRKIDYFGSQPVASKLLFAPPAIGTEDDAEYSPESFEMCQELSGCPDKGDASCTAGI